MRSLVPTRQTGFCARLLALPPAIFALLFAFFSLDVMSTKKNGRFRCVICRRSAADCGGRALIRVGKNSATLAKLTEMVKLDLHDAWKPNMRVCIMHFLHQERRRLNIARDFDFLHGGRGHAAASEPRESPAQKASKRKRAVDELSGVR